MDPKWVKLSKLLSFVTRHGATQLNIQIDQNGFISVAHLLNHDKFKNYSLYDIFKVVETNEKKRFQLMEINDELCIRANQGHSLQVDVEMKRLNDLDQDCFHGTFLNHWDKIKQIGLSRMNRIHIHLTTEKKYARSNCNLFIFIDIKQAIEDGIEFYMSSNNVILTKGINGILPPKYFKKVIDKDGLELPVSDSLVVSPNENKS
jgi:2'-phosphotransferase